ncbi:T9SS type A sorting domain-containing protein [Neolewinella litorea]|uniref:T9SS type A sorting domain-containing protein n=1 Tax=Neolewinella litorea TaxID=2562452 RepID=A0A4S4NLF3_9BACT|nr:T9SS type A sorting domain-containing protein [Neolewinella litorea]THH40612.1 T9SS type A sorting domain-containing protein [Neolewinella litorea]
MPRILTLLLLLAFTATLSGQIVLTDAYFPVAGDTLRYNTTEEVSTVVLLDPGADRQWDFGTLSAGAEADQVVTAVAGDPRFTNASLSIEVDSATVGLFQVTPDAYSLIGIRGSLDVLPGYTFEAPVSPARPERRAPLSYQDNFDLNTTITLTVATDSLPTSAREQFGNVLNGVDSIRIISRSAREDVVDAYGTLTLNGQTYAVLRERRTEVLNNRIEIKIGALPYTDVTSLVAPQVPEFSEFFGLQPPQTTYYFWSDTEKEAIATVAVDEDGNPEGITYIRSDATSSVGDPFLHQARIHLYPNPASRFATIELEGLDAGTYTLRVVNVLGRQVATQQFFPTGFSARVDLDVSRLPRGTYLYSITNERGRTLTTQRLLVGG